MQSIAALTPELLYACTDAFYTPSNMVPGGGGNITLEQAVEACRRAGLDRPAPAHTVSLPPVPDPGPIVRREMRFTMPVDRPCFALAYREAPIARGDVKREILCDILPDLVCGGLTDLYRKLYDEGLVNPEFNGDYVSTRDGPAAFCSPARAPIPARWPIWSGQRLPACAGTGWTRNCSPW